MSLSHERLKITVLTTFGASSLAWEGRRNILESDCSLCIQYGKPQQCGKRTSVATVISVDRETFDRQQWHKHDYFFGYCHKNVISSEAIWAAKEDSWILFEYWLRKTGSWDAIELDFGIPRNIRLYFKKMIGTSKLQIITKQEKYWFVTTSANVILPQVRETSEKYSSSIVVV